MSFLLMYLTVIAIAIPEIPRVTRLVLRSSERSPAMSWSATASGFTRRRMVRMRASSSGTEKGFTM